MSAKQNTKFGAFVILNEQGHIWTPLVFETRFGAIAHIRDQASRHGWDLSKHCVSPVKVTLKLPAAGAHDASTTDGNSTPGTNQ